MQKNRVLQFVVFFILAIEGLYANSIDCRNGIKSFLSLELLDFKNGDTGLLKKLFVSRAKNFLDEHSSKTKLNENLERELESILKLMLRLHDQISNAEHSIQYKQFFSDQSFENSILNLAELYFSNHGTHVSSEEVRDPEAKKNYRRLVIHPSAGFFGVIAANIRDHYDSKLLWDIRHLRFLQAEAAFDPEGMIYLGRYIFPNQAKSLTSSLWHEIDHAHIDRLMRGRILLPIHGHIIQPLTPVAGAYGVGFDLAELRTLAKDSVRVVRAVQKAGKSLQTFDAYFSLLRHPLEDLVSFSKNWLESLIFFENQFSEINKEAISVSVKSLDSGERQVKFLAGLKNAEGVLLDIRVKTPEATAVRDALITVHLRYSMDVKKVLESGIGPQHFDKSLIGHGLHFSMPGAYFEDPEFFPEIVAYLRELKAIAEKSLISTEAALLAFQDLESERISISESASQLSQEAQKKWELLEKKIQELPIYSLSTDELKKFHQNRRSSKED